MTYFQLGSLTIPAIWLAVLTTLVLASLFNRAFRGKKSGDWYWNGFIIYFLVWKLSYIAFNFTLFLQMPLSIVYFNGGTKGHVLAIAILSIYILFLARKKYPVIYEEAPQLFLLYFLCYQIVVNILEQNIIEAIIYFIPFGGYLFLLYSLKKKKLILSNQLFIVIMMLELLIFSLFQSLLSVEVLTFCLLGITAIILTKMNKES